MIPALLLIARLLAAPTPLVALVDRCAREAGVDPDLALAVVAVESRFDTAALGDDGTSWGLWQLCGTWHPQYRDDLTAHCRCGARYLAECIARYGTWGGVAAYNSGAPQWDSGKRHAARVREVYRLIKAQRKEGMGSR